MSGNRQYSILSNDIPATSSLAVTQDNSIGLSLRNKKSKRKISNISSIPIDLTSDEHLNVQHNHVQLISGISKGNTNDYIKLLLISRIIYLYV